MIRAPDSLKAQVVKLIFEQRHQHGSLVETLKAVALGTGYSHHTIKRWVKEHEYRTGERVDRYEPPSKVLKPDVIRRIFEQGGLYRSLDANLKAISGETGYCVDTLRGWLKEYEIKSNTRALRREAPSAFIRTEIVRHIFEQRRHYKSLLATAEAIAHETGYGAYRLIYWVQAYERETGDYIHRSYHPADAAIRAGVVRRIFEKRSQYETLAETIKAVAIKEGYAEGTLRFWLLAHERKTGELADRVYKHADASTKARIVQRIINERGRYRSVNDAVRAIACREGYLAQRVLYWLREHERKFGRLLDRVPRQRVSASARAEVVKRIVDKRHEYASIYETINTVAHETGHRVETLRYWLKEHEKKVGSKVPRSTKAQKKLAAEAELQQIMLGWLSGQQKSGAQHRH